MKKQEIGQIGEEIACEYLIKWGYTILQRNHREKFGEIDIIARESDQTIVFVEVKALSIGEFSVFLPEYNFTTHKSIKVNRTCEFFAAKHSELINEEKGWRIDLIAVEISQNGKYVIRHYKNV